MEDMGRMNEEIAGTFALASTSSDIPGTEKESRSSSIVFENDPCRPVYETDSASALGRRLVATPWMLMDGLAECREEAEALLRAVEESGIGLERRHGLLVNPMAERLEKLHFGVSHLLKLLWRSGLWTDQPVDEAVAADGRTYLALRAPFTDGKEGGRPVAPEIPFWQRELLGLPPISIVSTNPDSDANGEAELLSSNDKTFPNR